MSLKILTKEELQPKIGVVVGTRPGIIKFSPVIRELARRDVDFFVIHTGQHYSFNMDKQFFEDLELPMPAHTNSKVKDCKLHGEQTAEMIRGVEQAVLAEKPQLVVVGGDANTNLAGALAVRKLNIKLAHMEAGLRSNDWSMPEEHNRVIIDHISDILLCPTEGTRQNLLEDNVKGEIHITGNTIVDAALENSQVADRKSTVLETLGLETGSYFLFTAHREENVDVEARVKGLVSCLEAIAEKYSEPILFPMHPRTIHRLTHFGVHERFKAIKSLRMVDAVGYLDFLKLLKNAKLVLTDSGGIQEEACILQVPCVTLRDNTERPETVEVGGNILASVDPQRVMKAASHFLDADTPAKWENPFGTDCAKKLVDILIANIDS